MNFYYCISICDGFDLSWVDVIWFGLIPHVLVVLISIDYLSTFHLISFNLMPYIFKVMSNFCIYEIKYRSRCKFSNKNIFKLTRINSIHNKFYFRKPQVLFVRWNVETWLYNTTSTVINEAPYVKQRLSLPPYLASVIVCDQPVLHARRSKVKQGQGNAGQTWPNYGSLTSESVLLWRL